MKKTIHFPLLLLTALIFCFVFSAETIQASGSDVSGDIYKLASIDGVDISALGVSEEMMTATFFPDGTGTLNREGTGADFIFRKLDGNNISIDIEGDEIPGTLNGDVLTLTIDEADFVLVKDSPELVEEDKLSSFSNLLGTLWSALISEKKEQEPAPTPTEIPQPTVEPAEESIPSGFKDKLADLTNTVRDSQPVAQEEQSTADESQSIEENISSGFKDKLADLTNTVRDSQPVVVVQEEQINADESRSTEENISSGSKNKWAELADAVRDSQNSEQNEQPTAVMSQPTATPTKTELKRPAEVYTEPTKPAQTSAPADEGRYIGSCRMKSYLKPGDHAEVVTERGLKMRKKPAGSEIGVQAFSGKDVKILDGPTCVNGYVWFEIDFLGYRGWSMEGKDGIYYLRKTNGTPTKPDPSGRRSDPRPTAVPSTSNNSGRSMNQSKLKIGDTVNIVNTSGLQMFFTPGGKAMADKQAFPGKTAKITDGPKIIDGVIWWEIDFLGYRGWATEFVPPKTYYLEKK